jgi:hypothetical protein
LPTSASSIDTHGTDDKTDGEVVKLVEAELRNACKIQERGTNEQFGFRFYLGAEAPYICADNGF